MLPDTLVTEVLHDCIKLFADMDLFEIVLRFFGWLVSAGPYKARFSKHRGLECSYPLWSDSVDVCYYHFSTSGAVSICNTYEKCMVNFPRWWPSTFQLGSSILYKLRFCDVVNNCFRWNM